MDPVHFYFDESGAKGFLVAGFPPDEIGLIAGLALPQRLVPEFEGKCSKFLKKIDTKGVQKLHASKIFKNGKNADIKQDLLEYFLNREEWLLIYEAIYPLGMHLREELTKKMFSKHKTDNPGRVKISRNDSKLRIYTALLEGIIIKLDEICRIEGSAELLMVSDRLDVGLHKEALKTLNYLKKDIHVTRVSGFDQVEKKVVYGSIKSQITGFDARVRYISDIRTETTASYLTIAADILTNTLYRHLKYVINQTPSLRLHGKKAVEGFVLRKKIAFIDDEYIMDTIYALS